MAHPMKGSIDGMMSAKLHRMTRDYGSADPKANVSAPTNRAKQEGPEDAVGFGAESNAPSARPDRASRKPKAPIMANPLPTYATGGAVKRASGGRTKHKGTHVNVIVAPQGGGGMPPPPMAGANPAVPPMPPAMPPKPPMMPPGAMGAPGGMPPGPMPPSGGMPGLRAGGGRTYKKGGRVHRDDGGPVGSSNASQMQNQASEAMAEQARRQQDEFNTPKRARGGRTYDAGAGSGPGRLEKVKEYGKNAHEKPQAV